MFEIKSLGEISSPQCLQYGINSHRFHMKTVYICLRKSYTVWYCSTEEEKIKVDGFSCRNAQYATLKKNDEIFSGELTYLSYNSSNLIGVKSELFTLVHNNMYLKMYCFLFKLAWKLIQVWFQTFLRDEWRKICSVLTNCSVYNFIVF